MFAAMPCAWLFETGAGAGVGVGGLSGQMESKAGPDGCGRWIMRVWKAMP